LLAREQIQVSSQIGETLEYLTELALQPRLNSVTRTIFVEGPATSIVQALSLPQVEKATLDQPIELVPMARDLANLVVERIWHGDPAYASGVYTAALQFVQDFVRRYGSVRVLGMRNSVSLESIYTELLILDPAELRRYELDQIEAEFRSQRRFEPRDLKRMPGIGVANREPYVMMLGGPGCGKTTFLRKLGLECLKGQTGAYHHRRIPVLLELKDWVAPPFQVRERIADVFRRAEFPFPERLTDQGLADGLFLILLDGLDEVPREQQQGAIQQIRELVQAYPNQRYVCSCRVASYQYSFASFTNVGVAEFDNDQIRQFIFNWFRANETVQFGTAQACWDLLQRSGYEGVLELARTPLLLTLICLTFDNAQTFPKKRAQLYREALDVFLKRWAAEKKVQRNPVYQELGIGLEEAILEQIAYQGFENNQLFFSREELIQIIKDFLSRNLHAPKSFVPEEFIKQIENQQGILVERVENRLSFSHLSLQEYLAAQYVLEHSFVEKIIEEHLIESQWQQVFLLVSGSMKCSGDSLLLKMEKVSKYFIATFELDRNTFLSELVRFAMTLIGLKKRKLYILRLWAVWISSQSQRDSRSASKRSLALYFLLNQDYIFARSLCLSLAYHLDKSCMEDFNLDSLNILNNFSLEKRKANLQSQTSFLSFDDKRIIARFKISVVWIFTTGFSALLIFQIIRFLRITQIAQLALPSIVIYYILVFVFVCSVSLALKFSEFLRKLYFDITAKIYEKRFKPQISKKFNLDFLIENLSSLIESQATIASSFKAKYLNLDKVEKRNLEAYLYVHLLIVKCKDAAMQVSPEVWEKIEARMLMP
jgi:hypothetical protein